MNNIFIPAVNNDDVKIIDIQIFKEEKQNKGLIITGLIDEEFEDSICLSISILKKLNIDIPPFLHIHFPDYNYIKSGISVSLGMFLTLYCFLKNIDLKKKYMITGEIDLFGNIYSIGAIEQKYNMFKKLNLDYFIIPYGNIIDLDKDNYKIKGIKTINDLIVILEELENEIK